MLASNPRNGDLSTPRIPQINPMFCRFWPGTDFLEAACDKAKPSNRYDQTNPLQTGIPFYPSVDRIVRILVDGVVHLLHQRQGTHGGEVVVRHAVFIFKATDQGEVKNYGG